PEPKAADQPESVNTETAPDTSETTAETKSDTDTDTDADAEKTETGPDAAVAAEAAKQAEHDAAMQKLVDSKQYFLPINAVEKRKSKHFVIFGVFLALVLAAAWVDIALDAGIITISHIKPVTHLFSN
ncbi:MAG TPA: hypothetical protein VG992_04065, partial [Candidatus Saccharimonadales bacterium]|nr:hypothetical protein [Candidatus Saccharimonadales bacterium]